MKVLNELLGYQLKIYQDDDYFKFSMDGVLLANFVKIKLHDKKILDIGTGTGIIPLILSQKTEKKIEAIEIQEELVHLFSETIQLNQLGDQIEIIFDDIRNFSKEKNNLNQYDVIISNPPYYTGKNNKSKQKSIARNQESLSLEDLFIAGKRILKDHGSIFFVYDIDQFEFAVHLLNQYHFAIKTIQFVHDTIDQKASVFLMQVMKNGNFGMKVLPPFILYDQDRKKTKQYQQCFFESR